MVKTKRYSKRRYYKRRYRKSAYKKLSKKVNYMLSRFDGECKKLDQVQQITQENFVAFNGPQVNTNQDFIFSYANLYNSQFTNGTTGQNVDAFSIKLKSLLTRYHFVTNQKDYSLNMRVVIIQDRSYVGGSTYLTGYQLVNYLFGVAQSQDSTATGSNQVYSNKIDLVNMPYSPLQPGRFNVLRDFHLVLNPGASTDKYKSCYVKQKQLSNYGRIKFGSSTNSAQVGTAPAQGNMSPRYGRNLIYTLFLIQNPQWITTGGTKIDLPQFRLDVMSRTSYYDN